jgi:predicted dehydrogenase
MQKKLRVGILGSGFIALTHAEAFHRAGDAEVAAVAGGRKAGELAGQYGARFEPSVESLVEAKDIDAVVVWNRANMCWSRNRWPAPSPSVCR